VRHVLVGERACCWFLHITGPSTAGADAGRRCRRAAYGRAMNTFWGCETENLTELSGVVAARALRMRAIVLQIALSVRAVGWIGPDADDYRLRAEDLVDRALELIETLRRLGEVLGREAEEQDLCSQPDGVLPGVGDPLGVRAECRRGTGARSPRGRSPSPRRWSGGSSTIPSPQARTSPWIRTASRELRVCVRSWWARSRWRDSSSTRPPSMRGWGTSTTRSSRAWRTTASERSGPSCRWPASRTRSPGC